jgi:hypothetical protein
MPSVYGNIGRSSAHNLETLLACLNVSSHVGNNALYSRFALSCICTLLSYYTACNKQLLSKCGITVCLECVSFASTVKFRKHHRHFLHSVQRLFADQFDRSSNYSSFQTGVCILACSGGCHHSFVDKLFDVRLANSLQMATMATLSSDVVGSIYLKMSTRNPFFSRYFTRPMSSSRLHLKPISSRVARSRLTVFCPLETLTRPAMVRRYGLAKSNSTSWVI